MKFFKKDPNRPVKRLLQIESLEHREMLSVAPLLYSIYSAQSQYSTDFNTEAIAAPTASDQTATSVKLTWNAATMTRLRPEEPFKIERSTTDSSGTEKWTQIGSDIPYSYTIGNGTYSYELKGLTASTEYKLRVSFSSTVLGRGYTEAVTVSTLDSEIKAEAVSSASIKLSWNIAGKTGTSFTVQKRLAVTTATWENTGITVKADGSATATKTCTVDSLDSATKYEFQVFYYDTTSTARTSQVTECTTLYVLAASQSTLNSVNLSWNAAMDGTSHEVQIYTGTTKPTATATWTKATAVNINSNEYQVTGLKENASYYFRVRYNVIENGETVTKYTDVLSYSSPTSIKLDNATENSIAVSWTFAAQSGTSYYIQTSATGADETWSDYHGANTTNKSYTLQNLDSGKEYYVRVRYYSPAAVESFSAAEHITTGIATKLEKVTENSATISWTIPDNPTVSIQRCDGSLDPEIDTNWRTIATNVLGTSYTNNNIGSNNKYYYRVSYESGGETKYTIYVTALTIGTVTVSDPSMDTVKLDWNFKPKQGTSLIVQQSQGNSVPASDSGWGTASVTLDSDNQGCTVTNLIPGQNYFFRVRYTSELGTVEQTTNATKIVMTDGMNLIASETNATSVTLRWAKTGFLQQQSKNFTVYRHDLSGANGTNNDWVAIATVDSGKNSYTVTNLMGDTNYQFKISYQGDLESQAVSTTLDLTTKPYTVDISNLTQNSAQLQWTFATDKDIKNNSLSTGDNNGKYIVQKYIGNTDEPGEAERLLAVNHADWEEIGTCLPNQPHYNLDSLTKNTTYYYRIVYTYRTGDIALVSGSTYVVPLETKFSEIVTVKTASDLRTSSVGSNSVNLVWDSKTLNSGTKYTVQYRINGETAWIIANNSVTATSYTCNKLLSDTDYEFCVVFNGSSETATIEAKTSKSILSVVSKELGIGTASAAIEMQTVTGESDFVLYYRLKGDETDTWLQNPPLTTNTGNVLFQLSSLLPETEYEFKIVYDSNSVSHESEIKFVSLSDDLMPSNVSGSSITIRWDDSSFPDKRTGSSYILQYRVTGSNAAWSNASTLSNNSCTVNNLSANTEYEFRVQYTTDGGATAYSTLKNVRTKQPVIGVSTPQVGKVKLTWTFESVDGYIIQCKDTGGQWVDKATVSTNTLRETTVEGLTAETDYTFRIAYKTTQSGNDFVYSDEAEITTLGGFSVVENSTGSQRITVKWDYVTNSTYRIQYKIETQTWIEIISDIPLSTKEYTLASLTPGNSYEIQLIYFDGTEKSVSLIAATTKTAPETPTGISVSEITDSGAKIKWTDNSEYEDNYIIEVTNNVTGIISKESIGDGLGTGAMEYVLTRLDTKISYTVKVYAKNTEGSSAIAQTTFTTLDVKRPAAVTTVKATATPKSITLSWKIKSVTDVPNPTTFRIEYYDDKDSDREKLWYEVQGLGSRVVGDSTTQTYSCTISNSFIIGDSLSVTLENKTAYQFRIIALAPTSTFGDASATSIKATTAALVVPSSLSAKNITLTSATISFKDTDKNVSPTEKTYTLYYVAGTKKYSKWADVPVAEIQSDTVLLDKLSYELTGLKAETVYTYIIESEYSGQKTVTNTASFTTAKMPTATTIKGGYTIITNKYSFLISWKPPAATKLSPGISIQYTLDVSSSGKKDTFILLPLSTVETSSSGLKYVTFSFSDVIKLLADNKYDVSTKVSALSFRVASTFMENNLSVGTSYSSAGRVTLPKFV
ncbi:MAG: fibronectin type III domain-containing protein [Planctomycetaceae bacterium]|jgi:hypothetical protein|nr:fibronectin type III domain-containing protein [Planctomycetaceae bacterium]